MGIVTKLFGIKGKPAEVKITVPDLTEKPNGGPSLERKLQRAKRLAESIKSLNRYSDADSIAKRERLKFEYDRLVKELHSFKAAFDILNQP